ncbi:MULTISPECIES: lipopolysaccharide biosynthesis protein [unclassified Marinobacter]|uniref:lipopolysaccharide biosynthesis protein n=1 Tax=unclassified Marinobacter TaxID=83889 RepID=UPI0018F1CB93|nr:MULTISPECIES: lipopolysaccharide biosynthesis protein [unclassified Marinobacter]
MVYKAKVLFNNKFVRNVFIVASGTIGAQAITMAFAPVITRLYGPEAFGLLGTFMAVLGVLTPVAALTYPVAIVLAKSNEEAKKIGQISAGVAVAVATISALIILFWADWLAKVLSLESVADFLWLVPLAMLFSAIQQIFTQWLIRKEQFRITARMAIFQALIMNSAKAGVGWFHPVGATLIIIASIGQAFHAFLLWVGARRSETEPSQNECNAETPFELAKRYRDFPLYRSPQVLINAISINAPTLFLASAIGPASAGYYAITRSVLALPSMLLSNSVKDVLYPKVVEALGSGRSISGILIKATIGLSVVGAIPLVLVVVFGPYLFGLVFGEGWEVSGHYGRWLALFMYFNLLNSPSVAIVPALRLERWALWHSVFSAGMRIAGLFIGYYIFRDGVAAVAVFSVLGSVCYLCLVIRVWVASKNVYQRV